MSCITAARHNRSASKNINTLCKKRAPHVSTIPWSLQGLQSCGIGRRWLININLNVQPTLCERSKLLCLLWHHSQSVTWSRWCDITYTITTRSLVLVWTHFFGGEGGQIRGQKNIYIYICCSCLLGYLVMWFLNCSQNLHTSLWVGHYVRVYQPVQQPCFTTYKWSNIYL